MKKKFLAFFLALILFAELLPLQAVAEAISASKQNALMSRAEEALNEDTVATDGMDVSSMSPYQLQIATLSLLEADFQDVLRKIEYLYELEDQGYDVSNSQIADSLMNGELWQSFMELWSQVEYAQFTLETSRSTVKYCKGIIESEDSTKQEKDEAYFSMSSALDQVDDIVSLCCANMSKWETELETYGGYVDALYTYGEDINAVRVEEAETISAEVTAEASTTDEIIKVLVLNSHQTGVNVLDENQAPVEGVTFTVKDHENSKIKSVSGKTSDTGAVAVDVAAFPFNEQGYCRLDASLQKDGYRTWRTVGHYVQPGNVLQKDVVLVKDDGHPYIEEVTMRGSDVLYRSDTIYITPKNDINHELSVYLNPKGTSGTVVVYYVENNEAKTLTQSYEPNTTKLTFRKTWCKDLTIGSVLSVELICNDYTEKRTLALSVVEAVVDEPEQKPLDILGAMTLFPGIHFNLKFHDKAWLNNMDFSLKFPFGPLKNIAGNFTMNPDGSYLAGINVAMSTTGKSGKEGEWKLRTDDTAEMLEHWAIKNGSMLEKMQEAKTLKTKPDSNWGKVSGGKISVGFEAVIHGKAVWNNKEKYSFRSNATIAVPFSFSYSYTQYFMAWAIPLHVGAEGGVNGSIGAQWKSSYTGDSYEEFVNLAKFIKNGDFKQLAISIAPYIKLFAGAGIRGVLGVTLQGMFNLCFDWVGERRGDAMQFSWAGNLSLIASIFIATLKQSIMKGGKSYTLFDNRKSESATESTSQSFSSSVAESISESLSLTETDSVQVSTGSEAPSALLQVSTTETNISPDLSGATDSTVTDDGIVYITLNENDQPVIGWTGTDRVIHSENQVLLSQIPGDGDKFDSSQYYLYSSRMASAGSQVLLCMLMAKHSEDVTKQLENEDGTTQTVKVPGKTYIAVCELYYDGASVKQLDANYTKELVTVDGSLGNLDVMITNVPTASSPLLNAAFAAVQTDTNEVYHADLCFYNDKYYYLLSASFNVKSLVKSNGYTFKSLNQMQVSKSDWFTSSSPSLVYCLFTDQNDVKHIVAVIGRNHEVCFMKNDKLAGMTTLIHNAGHSTWREDLIFVTESDGSGRYNLVPYTLYHFTMGKGEYIFQRQSTWGVNIPNPQVQCAKALGVNTIYWLESGSLLEGDQQTGQYMVRCCYVDVKENDDIYVTKPVTLMTFSSKDFPVTKSSLSNLRVMDGPWGYSGFTQVIEEGKGRVVAFKMMQAVSAEIQSAMLKTPLISEGDPVTVLFTIQNNGNTPLGAVKMKITDTSDPEQNYEEVLVDFLKPEESSVSITQGEHVVTLNGLTAVSEYEGLSSSGESSVFFIDANGQGKMVEYKLLMPGETKTYRVVFTIPQSWGTGEKRLYCTLTDYRLHVTRDEESGQWTAVASLGDVAEVLTLDDDSTPSVVTASNSLTATPDDEPVELWLSANGSVPDGDEYESFVVGVSDAATTILFPDPALTLDASYLYENGQRMIQVNMESNSAQKVDSLVLRSYLDGSDVPAAELVLTPEYGLDKAYGLNMQIPQDVLTGGANANLITLEIEGKKEDGTSIQNENFCGLYLNQLLTITQQPADVTLVAPKTEALFETAAKGPAPLSYQWQYSEDGGTTWTDLAGATESSLNYTCDKGLIIRKTKSTLRFRCQVSAGDGQTAVTDSAALYRLPKTGDQAQPEVWIALMGVAIIGAVLLVLKRKKKA